MSLTLLFTFYRDVPGLLRNLERVRRQSMAPDQVIVADDGSEAAAGEALCAWANETKFPLIHAWHVKDGFRAGEIRNKGVSLATGDSILFVDHDCLLHSGTVAAWNKAARPDTLFFGPRIDVMPPSNNGFDIRPGQILTALLRRKLFGWRTAVRPARMYPGIPDTIQGCNMLIPRAVMVRSNGFDETFRGWGYEDAEFVVRAVRGGCKAGMCGWRTTVFHLWHPSRSSEANRPLFDERVKVPITRAALGLDRHNPAKATLTETGCYRRYAFNY